MRHLVRGQSPKLRIDQRQQFLRCRAITTSSSIQQSRHLGHVADATNGAAEKQMNFVTPRT